jgi:hypothetical protein
MLKDRDGTLEKSNLGSSKVHPRHQAGARAGNQDAAEGCGGPSARMMSRTKKNRGTHKRPYEGGKNRGSRLAASPVAIWGRITCFHPHFLHIGPLKGGRKKVKRKIVKTQQSSSLGDPIAWHPQAGHGGNP